MTNDNGALSGNGNGNGNESVTNRGSGGGGQGEVRDRFSETYQKQRDGFIRDLKQFHETKGNPIKSLPAISGYEIDLYLLYSLVTEHGGWLEVSSRKLWDVVIKELGFPFNCTNATVALKQMYYRYLDKYEKCHYLCEDIDQANDDVESRVRRLNIRSIHAVPMTYNYQQHIVPDGVRESNNLSEALHTATDYDRLLLSLICPLPNEQDFAINVCNLISNEGRYTIKLAKCPLLIDFLLAHTGLYRDASLKSLFSDIYGHVRPHSLNSFWFDVLENLEYFDLADNGYSLAHGGDVGSDDEFEENNNICFNDIDMGSSCVEDQSDSFQDELNRFLEKNQNGLFNQKQGSFDNTADNVKIHFTHEDKELFCLGRSLGTQEYIGQRVQQIANIIRNLSFFESNHEILASSELLIRFIILCINSKWNTLHQNAFDILGNIANVINLRKFKKRLVQSTFQIIKRGLYEQDRSYIIASLEVLRKFCEIESNVPLVVRSLRDVDYQTIVSFLTIQDIMLIIYTLECLYTLTCQGDKPCLALGKIQHVLYLLVDLVTVEAKSYGTKACIGMKLLETVTAIPVSATGSSATTSASASNSAPVVSVASSASSAAVSGNTSTVQSNTVVSGAISNVTNVVNGNTTNSSLIVVSSGGNVMATNTGQSLPKFTSTSIKTAPMQVRTSNGNLTTVLSAIPLTILKNPVSGNTMLTTAPSQTQTSTAVVNQVVAQQQQQQQQQQSAMMETSHQQLLLENEQFASVWLQANFEQTNLSMHTVETQELYKNYLSSCSKYGRRGVIAPLHFPKIVRNHFGSNVGPYKGKTIPKTESLFYEGIKTRAVPLQIHVQSTGYQAISTTTCISTTPMTVITTSAAMVTSQQQSQVMAHPHLSQALLGVNATTATTSVVATTTTAVSTGEILNQKAVSGFQQNNSSLIKSLLATKVVQRQQQQQKLVVTSSNIANSVLNNNNNANIMVGMHAKPPDPKTKMSRINGARPFMPDTSESQTPPPLAPLSQNKPMVMFQNNGIAGNSCDNSSSSMTIDDGTEDNSLTSFEGIFNGGAPNTVDIDGPPSSNGNSYSPAKTLHLADLLEKKVDNKEPPILNGATMGKELRIGDKGLELVENSDSNSNSEKRSYNDEESANESNEIKKLRLDDEEDDSYQNEDDDEDVECEEDDNSETNVKASATAANLYAAFAASALEDEDVDDIVNETPPVPTLSESQPQIQLQAPPQPQIIPEAQKTSATMAISKPQPQTSQQIPLIVQTSNSTNQRSAPLVLTQGNSGQLLMAPGGQTHVQLVPSSTQPGQFVLSTSQNQTVLLAQTTGQPGSASKTIIILQPQNHQGNANSTGQKVLFTPHSHPNIVVSNVPSKTVVQQSVNSSQTTTTIVPVPSSITTTKVVNNGTGEITPNLGSDVQTVTNSQPSQPQIPRAVIDYNIVYVCEWLGCNHPQNYKSANEVFLHAYENHCPTGTEEVHCLWDRCDLLKRRRYSLMTHLLDKHCSAEAMKQSSEKRKKVALNGGKCETPEPQPATFHPGYGPDAAIHAIKRHALDFSNAKELQKSTKSNNNLLDTSSNQSSTSSDQEENEGPVTKSIRLTACLILRNLVVYNKGFKQRLRLYESHLANISFSNVESARTMAYILFELSDRNVDMFS